MFPPSRLRSAAAHNDGIDAWRMASIAPPAVLGGLVDGYIDYRECTTSFATRRELPHARAVLIVNLASPLVIVGGDGHEIVLQAGEAFVAGAHLRPALSRSTGTQAGIHVILPLASIRRLAGLPMTELVDRVLPLDVLLRGQVAFCRALVDAKSVSERVMILDSALAERFSAAPALPDLQTEALRLLRTRPDLDIADVARSIGWSRKHLANRLHDATGVGPRTYRRLIRFEHLTARLRDCPKPEWSKMAHDGGYCDQSHMIREFREFAEITPSTFLARSLPDGGGLIED